ncbi:MAG: SAM-dependent methyltransferase [Actinomycetota bacterium]
MTGPKNIKDVAGSFRDPSGFLFYQQNRIYRQVNNTYRQNYDLLMQSGLYEELTQEHLLIDHREIEMEGPRPDAYKIIEPRPVDFISYPHEWCFSQLKDAALATFRVQKKAMEFGMTLKDCSAYNIQFRQGKPLLIDTLSFEKYTEGQIWTPYRQACQHFIAPLALMSYRDIRLNQLFRIYLDGIPLDLASSLLPLKTRLNLSLFSHIHLHAKSQKHFADKRVDMGKRKISRMAFMGLTDSLESLVRKMKWKPAGTEWARYYQDTNYTAEGFEHKKKIVEQMLSRTDTKTLWDIGANDGLFSRIASDKGIYTISFDIDYGAVEKNYLRSLNTGERNILPLILDLTNPSPGMGWENKERMAILERGPADTVFALALVHHLAISNNLPFAKIADFFTRCCSHLIIEFVPKSDSQVQRLLSTREDIFPNYDRHHFEEEFSRCFAIKGIENIKGSERIMYLMEKKEGRL